MGSVGDPGARVYIHTLGCPKNEADSRAVMRRLVEAGVTVVDEPQGATHILLNTCGFVSDAKEESIEAILNACAEYPDRTVMAMGCLVERYRDALAAGIPEVAAWFGVVGPEVEDLLTGIRHTWRGRRNYVRLDPNERVGHVMRLLRRLCPDRAREQLRQILDA